MNGNLSARREFLRFLAASPVVAMAQEPGAKDALSEFGIGQKCEHQS